MWSPYCSFSFVLSHVLFLLNVNSREKHGVESNISGKSCITGALTKNVNLPAYLWVNVKFLLKELSSNHEVIKDLVICGSCLIWWTPSTSNKIKLAVFNEFLHFVLKLWLLIIIPSFEIFHLRESKSSIFMNLQFSNSWIKDVFDSSYIDSIFVVSGIEVIFFADPSFICMRVRKDMHNFLLACFDILRYILLKFLEVFLIFIYIVCTKLVQTAYLLVGIRFEELLLCLLQLHIFNRLLLKEYIFRSLFFNVKSLSLLKKCICKLSLLIKLIIIENDFLRFFIKRIRWLLSISKVSLP